MASVPYIALTEVSDAFYPEQQFIMWEAPNIGIDDLDVSTYSIDIGTMPVATLNFHSPTLEPLEGLSPIDVAISVDWPTLVAEAPVLDFSGTPGALDVGAYDPGAPPITSDIDIPAAPSPVLPDAPVIADIIIPTMPEVTIEDFDKELILNDIPQTKALEFVYAPYYSDLGTALVEKILARLMIGGSGLEAPVEEAIFEREKLRVEQTFNQGLADGLGFFESRGWGLPSGMMSAKFEELTKTKNIALLDSSNGIMIKQAELAKDEGQFILKTGLDAEQILRTFFLEETKIKLEASKAIAENNIEIVNAAISTNNAAIAAYNAQAQVYNTKVQAALAKIEIFKAELEGAKLTAETQKLLVDIYNALLQGVLAESEIYKTRMQGADIAMSIQKTKLDVYTARIGAFTAMVQAWATEWKAYESKVSAQTARVQAYGAEVSAYQTEVEATKSVAQISIEEAKLKLESNRLVLQQNEAKLSKFDMELKSELGQLDANVKVYGANIQAYQARIGAIVAEYDAHYKAGGLRIEAAKTKAMVATEVAKLTSTVAISQAQIGTELSKSIIAGGATIRAAIAGQTHKSGTASDSSSKSDSTVKSSSSSTSSANSTISQTQAITSSSSQVSVVHQFITNK